MRTNNYDFLRLFAAFSVMVVHSTTHIEAPFLWVYKGVGWFHDGVPLFFILSGMLVYLSYEKCINAGRPLMDFYRNRFLRIAPAIYAYGIVTTIILLSLGVISVGVLGKISFWGWMGSNLFLIPVYFPDVLRHIGVGVLNGSLWTIPAEVSFYLFVPLIFLLEKRLDFKRAMAIILIISLMGTTVIWKMGMTGTEPLWFKFFKVSFMSGLASFSLGIFWLRVWKYAPKGKILFLASVVIYVLGTQVFRVSGFFGPAWDLVRAIPLSYAVVWFGYNGSKMFSDITSKIGDLSYGIYIWHMVVVNLFLYFNLLTKLNWLPGTIIHLLVFVITFLLAKLSWTFIEKPSLRLKNFTSREAPGISLPKQQLKT